LTGRISDVVERVLLLQDEEEYLQEMKHMFEGVVFSA
jgi:hypothetical protein